MCAVQTVLCGLDQALAEFIVLCFCVLSPQMSVCVTVFSFRVREGCEGLGNERGNANKPCGNLILTTL